ncbi:conserved hypothetical protein [Trichinella spiralis]|uniref:hypothetical protein n=1 Tax=Trichinella spiralis TaxID=6334 RepID=UPI0001EFE825|nr:conserved hypothetical protein [Trichinella spiralis]
MKKSMDKQRMPSSATDCSQNPKGCCLASHSGMKYDKTSIKFMITKTNNNVGRILVKQLETIALSISGRMAKKTVSVPVVHKEIGKEDLPKRDFKILTKFRQENVSGLEKVDRIIPAVKDIISIKENCKAAAENALDQLNQQDIHKENVHLLLEKRIIEYCQCMRDHQEQELLKIGITEKLHDCLSLFESVLQMLGLEYCKDAVQRSSVGIALPRLLENLKICFVIIKNVDLLTTP